MKSFSGTINAWVAKSDRLVTAVVKQSTQTVADEVTRPIALGGYMPIKSGFLRNSVTANIGAMPSGPTTAAEGSAPGGQEQITTEIIRWTLVDPMFIGVLAIYGRRQEANYAFLRRAAQRWQAIVRQTANDAKRAAR